ncbi:hypothetical protein [Lacinutrix sp. MedPE-SW]|uniref:hypothetical protein n=1 Tax=Lacinutrix sp. MedPE-SW TaxID=1860087 RepID=UPI000918EF61|nr:hypothetical protein [Lacinutrix sp. MedPE-SW]OIQ24022.1 MAG: hypothetical protein BM549_01555 [Lacinutrix sp. MedPE-SW]
MPNPSGIITPKQAKELNDNWTRLRASANKSSAGQDDNRSSWYSLEDMEQYIELIKNENPNVNGIRFYLGVETTETDPKGLTTIFMVPTEEKDGENADIAEASGMDRGGVGGGRSYPQ